MIYRSSGEQLAAWQSKQPQPEDVHQTEDCLKLTIRTPIGAENLPVMVWIQCVVIFIDACSAHSDQLDLLDSLQSPHPAAAAAVPLLFVSAEAITKTAARSSQTSRVPTPCLTKEWSSSRLTIDWAFSGTSRTLTLQ